MERQHLHEPLQVGKIDAVSGQQGLLVALTGAAERAEERVAGGRQQPGIDPFFRNLVEIASRAFNGCPARLPSGEETAVIGWADDLVEVFEYEEKLCQFVQSLVIVSKFRPVPMLGEHLVAEAVDGRDRQFGKVSSVAHLAGGRGQPVAHLEGGFVRKGTKDDLPGLGLAQ